MEETKMKKTDSLVEEFLDFLDELDSMETRISDSFDDLSSYVDGFKFNSKTGEVTSLDKKDFSN
jgi:hypothetical protein